MSSRKDKNILSVQRHCIGGAVGLYTYYRVVPPPSDEPYREILTSEIVR